MPGARVHIVDRDIKRRAVIAFGLASNDYSPEIYEDLDEVAEAPPRDGFVLLNDGFADHGIAQLTAVLSANLSRVPIIVFGERPSTGSVVQAMLAGAVDFLEWPFTPERFDATVARANSDGGTHPRIMERRHNAAARLQALTEREREVLRHLIRGLGSKDVAVTLGISPRTVEVHRANMITKLSARSTSDAIRIGIYGGLDD
jgi:two-component system, LuxR family, response regulator FixJ